MPNSITANGPVIETYAQILSDLQNGNASAPGFYQIYGPTINLASNSPDGQALGIFALAKEDSLNFGVSIYDSFDPDEAIGIAIDNISQICGISRKGGVYTQVVIQVVVSTNLNLSGQDASNPYTVQDGNGNQYQLIASASLTTGSNSLNFIAVNIGAIQVLANTITTPVTIIAGVTSVNNSAVPYVLGSNQETDANFRLRRQASTSFPSQGALNGIYADIANLSQVSAVAVYENTTAGVVNGIPAHGIWVVVKGGAPVDIAQVIYNRRSLGVPMAGSQSYAVPQVDGSFATMYWDNVVAQALYLEAKIDSINSNAINLSAILAALVTNWTFGIYQAADISTLDQMIRSINPNAYCTNLGVSADGMSWVNLLSPSSQQNQFYLIAANISLTT